MLKLTSLQDLAARVVGEAHAARTLTRGRAVCSGDRAVAILHVLALVEQAEQALEVGERRLDLAIHHAEQVQRRRQLQQVGVDQHQVADRHRAGDDARGRAPHHRGDADRDDRRSGRG